MMMRTLFGTVVLLVVIGISLLIYRRVQIKNQDKTYTSYETTWEKEELGSSDASYRQFRDGVVKLTRDGIACLDNNGETLWNYGYSMRNPQVAIRGEYGAIADIQSNEALIFDANGISSKVTTSLPILKATISGHGVLAVVLDESGANYIQFYDKTGAALDIKIKTKLSGDGYPLDICLSPEGTGLVSSVVYLDQNSMQNQIVFYNFDTGQSESNRMVGLYNFGDTMFPEVSYISDSVVAAFGDDQVNLYSLHNEAKPDELKHIAMTGQIYSVFYDENQVGVICQTDNAARMLLVFSDTGKLKYQQEITFDYDSAEFSNGCAVVSNSMECLILNSRGKIRYKGTLDVSIKKVICTGDRTCLIMSSSSVKKIRFQ